MGPRAGLDGCTVSCSLFFILFVFCVMCTFYLCISANLIIAILLCIQHVNKHTIELDPYYRYGNNDSNFIPVLIYLLVHSCSMFKQNYL